MSTSELPQKIQSTYGTETRMNEIMKLFFKDSDMIERALETTYSFIAGSAPLYALKPWSTSTSEFDGDIDIWSLTGYRVAIHDSSTTPVNMDLVRLNELSIQYWTDILATQGYIPNDVSAMESYTTQTTMDKVITKVLQFIHPTTKRRVQVIMCRERSMRNVLNIFDYTFCAIAWKRQRFYTDYLEDIVSGQGHLMNVDKLLRGREEKYVARGFTIVK